MVARENKIQSTLNNVIEKCKDGEQGFKTAAGKVKVGSLKSLFAKYASQRAQFALELQRIVTQMGGDPATLGHLSGTLHRGWLNLKEALSRDEDKAIVDECDAGEDATIKNYRDALSFQLPLDFAAIVQRQYADVQEAHSVIRNVKHGRARQRVLIVESSLNFRRGAWSVAAKAPLVSQLRRRR